ncbi:MAG TPA: ATP-binding cassette domain-containing protein, partial [Methyloceanibacter sp.]|nr:ATP-binding cassette domain-containing protein [Methyloceanibacter sp.]
VGYFAQHQIEELVADETPLQHMQRLLPAASLEEEVRTQLGRFGFSGDKVHVPVRQLSGGERARLSLALITREAPHMLILDEPTNHLDIEARDALVEALADFGGAVVAVSHDRHLLGLVADRLLLVEGGTVTSFDGSLEDYREAVLGSPGDGKGGGQSKRGSREAKRQLGKEARECDKQLRKAVAQAEAEVNRLWQRRAEIDVQLASPQANGAATSELMKTRAETEQRLKDAEHRWLEASEALHQRG